MIADQIFPDINAFSNHLRQLHSVRRSRVLSLRSVRLPRQGLTKAERMEILRKAGGRCHICGGAIDGQNWDADHVFPHSAGGNHASENYLPAHSLCNNYRWHYDTEEFQWIIKLGVWFRTHIEKQTPLGMAGGAQFVTHERRRGKRRRNGRAQHHGTSTKQDGSLSGDAQQTAQGTLAS